MSDRANILFLMPDQLRHDFLGCYGASFARTPNIDALAANGVRYDRAYSPSPVCVPARASLLTGMDALKTGVADNGSWLRPDLVDCGVRTWPDILGEAGYYTAAVGKMHFYPWNSSLGFAYRVAAEDKRWLEVRDDYWHFLHERGLRKYHGNEHDGYQENRGAIVSKLPWDAYWDRYVGQEACRFIRNHGRDGPWAMMVGFPGPHCPYDPCPEFLDAFDPADMPDSVPEAPDQPPAFRDANVRGNRAPWNGVDYAEFTEAHKKKIRAHYSAMVAQIDHEVGEIVHALRDAGQLDNTLIIFASDHGDYLGDHGLIGKGTFYESSTHVPMIVRPPAGGEPGSSDALVELTDVTATILSAAGCETPGHMDSRPLPAGADGARERDHIIGIVRGGWMNFDGRHKLAKYAHGATQLFDVVDDPGEQTNLARDPAMGDVVRRLDSQLTSEVMRSAAAGHADKRLDPTASSGDRRFGTAAWQRTYPGPPTRA
ncbi:sulfatase-like hydrolase/transferase [Candidatus Poribacteria bacterium]|jgi:arylsulfatase|nr:sulfatase-like hydrolase/transferase [Candidatus Poribacteria bacterium]MBT7808047.1 sulfatase-like hydrolase/transferase [Candidatus Poribacteria bacterium]